ncbi:dicarboxylate/amino acid:cation (Na+ or H+) symporter, DAACS family [Sphingobium sp. YR657]|nr:dicarboxylate/amino acid:cation (Na+ or H+) symporter, DAACS family [Sphingobium sp. YR657]
MSGSGTEELAGRRAAFSLQWQMLAGFLIGLAAGLVAYAVTPGAPWIDAVTRYLTGPIGQIFLRLLFMLVIPLLVSALIVGIAEMGEMRSLRRVGLRTLLYTLIVSGIAVVISLALVNLLQPGSGVDPAQARALLADAGQGAKAILDRGADTPTGMQALIAIVPDNVIAAMADNDILAVMVFALFFGIGLVLVQTKETKLLLDAMEGLFAVTMRLISIVIRLAPIAIACFMFNLAAQFGWDLLLRLSAYVGVVLLALAIQMFGIYSLLIGLLARRSPLRFFAAVQEASVMAFATASSNATLPTAIRVAEEKLHLPRRIARFVLTIGATANQNGTAMFEGITVLFLAQFFHVDLSLGQQLMVMLVCILGGVGTAGVPAGSLPVVAMILAMVGIPPEGIGLVLGVDRLLDMCRTALNVTGDLVAATVISAREEISAVPSPLRPPDERVGETGKAPIQRRAALPLGPGLLVQHLPDLADAQPLRHHRHAHGGQRHRPVGMAVHPGKTPHRVTGDRGRPAVELLEIMVDQILETRLHAAIIFARDEDEGIGSGQTLGKMRHGGGRLAGRVVAIAQVEHRQADRLGIDQFRLVPQPLKAAD